jgi:hypothetical protein
MLDRDLLQAAERTEFVGRKVMIVPGAKTGNIVQLVD